MNSATAGLEIYHTLVRAGLKEDVADDLAKQIVTRTEAKEILATKQDLHEATKWLVGIFIGIAFGQMAITLTVVGLMFNFYLG